MRKANLMFIYEAFNNSPPRLINYVAVGGRWCENYKKFPVLDKGKTTIKTNKFAS